MINQLRKSLKAVFLSMLVAAFAVVASGVHALSNSSTVVNSGDDAEVDSQVSSETDIDVENDNEASITQWVEVSSNTGNNNANGNIGDVRLRSGDSLSKVNTSVNANSNTTLVGLSNYFGINNNTDVVNTGDDADVETEVESETDIDVENDNEAWVNQFVSATADTGNNDTDDNIGDVDFRSGSAGVDVDVDADVNDNLTYIGSDDDNGNGGLVNNSVITNTGDDAEVDSDVESETTIDVRNRNLLGVWQSLFGESNSGNNNANDNIGDVNVRSGSAILASRLGVSGNTNTTGIGGSAVSPESETVSDVVNTGDDLDSESETEIEMEIDVENDNELWGMQWFSVSSETGFNDTDDNIGDVDFGSGVSGTGAEVEMGGNSSLTLLGSLGSLLNLLAL